MLAERGIHPSRSLGQNFLVDANIVRIIAEAAGAGSGDTVLEIKDLRYGEGTQFTGCGMGMLDFDYYLEALKRIGYTDTMIIHGVKKEDDFPYCTNFIQQKMQLAGLWNR